MNSRNRTKYLKNNKHKVDVKDAMALGCQVSMELEL
jgi:hypothetical protein